MDVRAARLNGVRAAAEVHERFGILRQLRDGLEQVDVFGLIHQLDIPVLCRPLDGLLGAFYKKDDLRGILVTSKRSLPIQRFTAAHELGHYWLGHEESLDSEENISFARQGFNSIPLQEVEAESFASELLLPKLLLLRTAKGMGLDKKSIRHPSNVYEMSLRMGVSYEATWRALRGAGFLTKEDEFFLGRTSPKAIKQKILKEFELSDPWADVFSIKGEGGGRTIIAKTGDVIVIELEELTASGYMWSFSEECSGVKVLADERVELNEPSVGSPVQRRMLLECNKSGSFHLSQCRPWQRGSLPISELKLEIDVRKKEFGLPQAVRI